MAADSQNATILGLQTQGTDQVLSRLGLNVQTATVEVTAAASANSIYTMFRIPANARIVFPSTLARDDLASTGSPTLDIGLRAVDSNITTDPDALNDGIDAATAGTSNVVKDIANYGKRAWEYVNGQTTAPGGLLDVIVSLVDADTNTGGTLTMTLYYVMEE
jgi:hypothetical protein